MTVLGLRAAVLSALLLQEEGGGGGGGHIVRQLAERWRASRLVLRGSDNSDCLSDRRSARLASR